MSQYTDMLGNPINVGDIIIYAVDRSGIRVAQVEKLVPLVEHPGGPWHATSSHIRIPWIREDQLHKSYPTEFYVKVEPNGKPRFEKAYVIQSRHVKVTGDRAVRLVPGRKLSTVQNDFVTVVTSLVQVEEADDA